MVKSGQNQQPSVDIFDVEYQQIPHFNSLFFNFHDISLEPILDVKILNEQLNISV